MSKHELSMLSGEALGQLISRMRAIASDCYDIGAAERLRLLVEELERNAKRALI